jgi:hypothetical protein
MAIRKGVTWIIVGGLIVALGLAFFVSPFASSSPDGLNKVAEDKGFIDTAEDHGLDDSPLAGYGVEGVDDESVSKGLSGSSGWRSRSGSPCCCSASSTSDAVVASRSRRRRRPADRPVAAVR